MEITRVRISMVYLNFFLGKNFYPQISIPSDHPQLVTAMALT